MHKGLWGFYRLKGAWGLFLPYLSSERVGLQRAPVFGNCLRASSSGRELLAELLVPPPAAPCLLVQGTGHWCSTRQHILFGQGSPFALRGQHNRSLVHDWVIGFLSRYM